MTESLAATTPLYALIVDRLQLTAWQQRALESIPATQPIIVLNCINSRRSRKSAANALYYALGLFTVRNPQTAMKPLAGLRRPLGQVIDFECAHDGVWQTLPDEIVARIREAGVQAVIKFGMSLLRVPPRAELPCPILSYHHGDPATYRGRPAAFHEMLHGRGVVGQVVQIIGNRLDAGAVLAFAETKVHPHSYRATLIEAYRHSPLLLARALDNATHARILDKASAGKNYRLPDNRAVVRFVLRMARATVARLFYGAFIEKAWRVSTAKIQNETAEATEVLAAFPEAGLWQEVRNTTGHVFYADPFFAADGSGLLLEALHARTGRGEILNTGLGGTVVVSDPTRHFSYPGSVSEEGVRYVVPEVAEWSEPRIYAEGEGGLVEIAALRFHHPIRVLDPTFVRWDERVYLFGNELHPGAGALRVWSAATLFDVFVEHPRSPVLVSPRGARMAGALWSSAAGLVRFGQDNTVRYGGGLLAFAISTLTPEDYAETPIGALHFHDVYGPHTLNRSGGQLAFDWYRERFSPFAGVRRGMSRLL